MDGVNRVTRAIDEVRGNGTRICRILADHCHIASNRLKVLDPIIKNDCFQFLASRNKIVMSHIGFPYLGFFQGGAGRGG